MQRRKFLQAMGVVSTVGLERLAYAQNASIPRLYYVDGYHGGVKGHMPPGSWRDILNTLRDLPKWKLCLDIEPASWDALKLEDPTAFAELKTYLDKQPLDARIEFVNGTFAQPF